MEQPNRFYWGFSHIYGNTVYDRKFQTPAFEYGASTDMSEYQCAKLTHYLNHLDRHNRLHEARAAQVADGGN